MYVISQGLLWAAIVTSMFYAAQRLGELSPISFNVAETQDRSARATGIDILKVALLFTCGLLALLTATHYFNVGLVLGSLVCVGPIGLITYWVLCKVAGVRNSIAAIAGLTAGILLTVFWLTHRNWLTSNVVLLIFCTYTLGITRLSFRTLLIVGAGVMLFDLVGVFGTGKIMELADRAPDMPALLTIPKGWSLDALPALTVGAGDIMLPGFVIMLALRTGTQYGKPSIGWATIAAYWIGDAVTIAILLGTGAAQPATIYLVPAVAIGFWLSARRAKVFQLVWTK